MVWVPRNGARERHVERVTGLVTDERANQYWDGEGAVIDPYDRMLDLTGPCAGIFAVFGPDATWDAGGPPEPDYFEDAHAEQYDREGPQWDARRFAEHVRAILDGAKPSR